MKGVSRYVVGRNLKNSCENHPIYHVFFVVVTRAYTLNQNVNIISRLQHFESKIYAVRWCVKNKFSQFSNTQKKAVSKCDLIPFISFFSSYLCVLYCVCLNNACILSSLPQTSCCIFLHYYHITLSGGRAKKRNEVEKKEEEEVQNSNLLNALKHLIINLMNNEETEASSSCKL